MVGGLEVSCGNDSYRLRIFDRVCSQAQLRAQDGLFSCHSGLKAAAINARVKWLASWGGQGSSHLLLIKLDSSKVPLAREPW